MRKFLVLLFLFVLPFLSFGFSFKTNGNFVLINNFESKYLGNKRTIRVFLPKDYFSSTNYYPVMYVHDGQNLFYDPANKMKWDLDKNIEKLEGIIKEIIVVGIDHAGVDRIKEYTPFPYGGYGGGKGKDYAKFLVEELKPFIETNFRVKTNKEEVGTFGSSLGGLISLYLGIWYPEVFGIVGCISPSFWWGLETNKIEVIKVLNKLTNTKIYIDMGYSESGEGESNIVYTTRAIYDILKNKIPFPNLLYYEDLKGIHNEISWNSRISNFFIFSLSSKPLRNEIKNVVVDVYPNEFGVGDRGFLIVNVETVDGVVRTEYDVNFNSDKFKVLDGGVIEAVSEGKGKVSILFDKFRVDKEIFVDSLSRKYGVANINVFTTNSSKVEFLVEEEDKIKTNYSIILSPLGEENKFFVSITNIRGKTLKGKFILDNFESDSKQIIINKRQKEYKFSF